MERKKASAYWERTKLPIAGAPDSMLERRLRWGALIVDGTPLGEHYTDEPHFEESAQLAVVLVSCGVDSEVKSMTRLAERQDTNTPDYRAELLDGRIVRIEITQFVDQEVMNYRNHWNAAFDALRTLLEADAPLGESLKGMHVLFEFEGGFPEYAIAEAVAAELLSLLRTFTGVANGARIDVADGFPALESLGATYTLRDIGDDALTVRFTFPTGFSDVGRLLESVPRVFNKKVKKYLGYSDDGSIPVWLASFARDEVAGYGLTAIQELMDHAIDVRVEPFERLMVANAVAGLMMQADRSVPAVYRSLTCERREVMRK